VLNTRPPAPAMNLSAVYRKTDAGIAEVRDRSLGLRAELRRLLILMDGVATVARLSTFVRASEIEVLIAELELRGLVTTGLDTSGPRTIAGAPMLSIEVPPAVAAAPIAATPVKQAAEAILEPSAAQVEAVRRTAVDSLRKLLGPGVATNDLALKIERCKTSGDMRIAINDSRQVIDRVVGVDVGQRFIDAVRGAAEGTR
jgi:hypothetical protein